MRWVQVSNQEFVFPNGSVWGDVQIDGLTLEEAQTKVGNYYLTPVTLQYLDSEIIVPAEALGYSLDLDLDIQPYAATSGQRFWASLWNKTESPLIFSVQPRFDRTLTETYLRTEIAPRYDQSIGIPQPLAGTTQFTLGAGGYEVDVEASALEIETALLNGMDRSIPLMVQVQSTPSVTDDVLTQVLKEGIADTGFDGVAEVVIRNLEDGSGVHFAVAANQDIPLDASFSAASTIKIPIMTSVLRRTSEPISDSTAALIDHMIVLSENPPADALMRNTLGGDTAPLTVSQDMQALGLENTFLAGFFEFGSPLLQIFTTPANSRTDINLNPDLYNQTTPGDMADLLTGIYQCANDGTGLLMDTYGADFTNSKCQYLLDEMKKNRIGALIQAGVPDGTPVGHKHGWTEESDGYLHTVSDVGIVYSPSADFVVSIYLYDYGQLLFDPANALIARLTQAAYNAYNLDAQQSWNFGSIQFPQN